MAPSPRTALVTPLWRLAGTVLLLAGIHAHAQQAAPRIALVIGNADYKSAPLKNPVNDARAVSRALKEVGFEVILKENLSQQGFVAALREFGTKLKNPDATGLFYYAGHGMQVKGANYLIPVDAAIEGEDEIRYMALDANQVLDKMEQAGNRLNIVILDACRDNPFARSFRSKQGGLAQMDAPSGMLVAFATAPGAVAYDGDGVNGVYTKHLLRNLTLPGLPVELVLKRVREGVSTETGGKQIPWESSSLLGDFYFKTAAVQSNVPVQPDAAALELAFWNAVKDSGAAGEYRAYLEKYPNGQFAGLARERMMAATEQAKQSAATKLALAQPGGGSTARVHSAIQPGDRWTYALLNRQNRLATVSFQAASVDAGRVEEQVSIDTVRGFKASRTFPLTFDLEQVFQEVQLPGGVILVDFSPYVVSGGLPQVGKEWRMERVRVTFRAEVAGGTTSMEMRAVAREKVRVPAGEFDALRIEARSADVWAAGGIRTHLALTYWYSEAHARLIKAVRRVVSSHSGWDNEDTLELLSVQAAAPAAAAGTRTGQGAQAGR